MHQNINVHQLKDNAYQFQMLGKQKGYLFVTFITFRQKSDDPDEANLERYIVPREITIFIKRKNQIQPLCGNIFAVRPQYWTTDLIFNFYEQHDKQIQIELPPLFCFVEHHLKLKPNLIASIKNITLNINDLEQIVLSFKSGEIGAKETFSIFAYRDEFLYDHIATW